MLRKPSLWGELSTLEFKPPIAILKEQATQLGLMTKGVLSAKVVTGRTRDDLELELRIVAPALDDYEYSVLFVQHSAELYPLTVVPAWDRYPDAKVRCTDEGEFEAALAEILGSERVRRVIASLLAQSKAE